MTDDKRPSLVLLPGALGAASQFADLRARLAPHFRLVSPDFEGHGPRPGAGRPFRMAHFVENLLETIVVHDLTPARVVGYSMGGYVALALARQQPDLIHSVLTLGTKFFWDDATAAREAGRLDPALLEAKVPQFAHELVARHPASGWQEVVRQTADLLRDLGANPLLTPARLAEIQQPVRVLVGDRDATVTVEETTAAWRALPNAQLQVLPTTPHPLERVSADALAASIASFMAEKPLSR